MARIDDVSTNDMSIKHLDTTKDIVITPMKEIGGPVQLNTAHTWTAKVSDWANYIGDYPVTIESNSIVVNSSEFTSLPAGSYHLEVWEEWIDSNNEKQRSIYPSPQRTIDFNIYRNIADLAEKEIKTIGFQDVVDQAVMNVWDNYVIKVNMIESDQTATVVQSVADGKNYITFNIPRGDVGPAPTLKIGTVTKLNSDQTPTANVSGDNGAYTLDLGIPQGSTGATGTVDNAGLISAPAFQSLQTQVDNSAVGTNLLLGTGNSLTMTGANTPNQVTLGLEYYLANGYDVSTLALALGKNFALSFDWSVSGSSPSGSFRAQWGGPPWGAIQYLIVSSSNASGHFSGTTSLSTDSTNIATKLGFRLDNFVGTLTISNLKLEKGSVATDWCPNPTEILTQSDYAKIKAAIVALGGSLS